MIRALLLGAFATAASADVCKKGIAAVACRNFAEENDFNVANTDGGDVTISGKTTINQAFQYIGDQPWNSDSAATSADWSLYSDTNKGCVFYDRSATGAADQTTAERVGDSSAAGALAWTCGSTGGDACDANGEAVRPYSILTPLESLVENLDDAGRFTLYFQRILENPFAASAGITLKWIAENACKIFVDVEFECTGGNCVEVTTIVCASFAGIEADNSGKISVECKVPNNFQIGHTPTTTAGTTTYTTGALWNEPVPVTNTNSDATGGADGVWTGTAPAVTATFACNSGTGGAGTGVCTGEATTALTLAQSQMVTGKLLIKAHVRQGAGVWTQGPQTLHEANYNLSRASNAAKTFSMPVNVLFYSDDAAALVDPSAPVVGSDMETAFSNAAQQRPFLAKTKIDMGAVTQHVHAYFSIVSKVDISAGAASFKNLELSSLEHNVQGTAVTYTNDAATSHTPAGAGAALTSDTLCTHDEAINGEMASTTSGKKWARAYLKCANLMDSAMESKVQAGDTLVAGLKWQLVGNAASNGAGKAVLLQDGEEAQSVEVSLTIQLGGGETTITTAGGSDGSADPTVTYIIIAVCIVAAGLILAVVVVAFMCLRNRSQEAIVSMSPQKCTVAAVYDISQPKKADAMDV